MEGVERQWREYLDGLEAIPFPSLPSIDHKPQASERIVRSIRGLHWPQENITSSTTVKAAWSIITGQYTGTSEALFGLKGSDQEQPVRVSLQNSSTLSQLLQQVQQRSEQLAGIEQLSLEQIRRLSGDCERATRFQTLLSLSTETTRQIESASETLTTQAVAVDCTLQEDGLDCQISFDPRVLGEDQMQLTTNQFEYVLRKICDPENASKALADIDFTSEADMETLWSWNANVPEMINACVHDLISEAGRRDPAAPAICAWDGEFSHGELEQLSTRLAHHLVAQGVTAKTNVVYYFEKSRCVPVVQLAIMKAGAASVGLEVRQPKERLHGIIEQTNANVIICSTAKKEQAAQLHERLTVVDVDESTLASLSDDHQTTLPIVQPEDNLYINFTSGSTGTPKGVVVTHRNVASALEHQRESLRMEPSIRLYDFASYSFDFMWGCMLHTLAAGACLCIPSEDDRHNRIAESMRSLRVNYAPITPTIARMLDPTSLPDLHTICIGGEAMLKSDRAQWLPHATLLNLYGPTECTIYSTVQQIHPSEETPTLGRAIGLNGWVVSTDGTERLVPVGAVGELALEGPLVATGYLADPTKTAAVFHENPSWLRQGGGPGYAGRDGRVYKTGDLVRLDSAGIITYIGRKDTQVKISGQRVELGDIEHHIHVSLANGAKAQITAEVIKPLGKDRPIVVAFLEIENEDGRANLSESETQAWVSKALSGITERLSQVLPLHMVPSAYVPIERMPLMTSGKTDRRKLREIGNAMTLEQLVAINPDRKAHRGPTNETEQILQELWASTLGMTAASIGLDDSFLEIGGDSLAAMRLVAAARRKGLSLTVAQLLKKPRLEDVAATVAAKSAGGAPVQTDAATNARATSASSLYPVTNFQHLCIDGALRTPKSWWDYLYLDFPQETDIAKLVSTCRTFWARHDILRMVFISAGDSYLQVALPATKEPSVVIHETDDETNHHHEEMCFVDDTTPVSLGTCFTKFFITKSSRGPTRLTLRISGAQYDGMSIQFLMEGLRAAFEGEEVDKVPQFSEYLDHNLKTSMETLQYWQPLLDGATMTKVPTALLDSDERKPAAILGNTSVPNAAGSGYTAATIFTSACAIALANISKTSDISFGRVVSGRFGLDEELQSIVGPCSTQVPVRVKFDGKPSLNVANKAVQAQMVDALSCEAIGLSEQPEEQALTNFGFLVQYRNVDVDPAVMFGETECHIKGYRKRDIRVGTFENRVEVLAVPMGDNLQVRMISRNHTRSELEHLFQEICAAMA